MSQSDKSDPKKPNNSKLVAEASGTTSEGPPSSDTTEEVVSAVNEFFGIGRDPSKNEVSKRIGSDPKSISKEAAADKNAIQQTEDSETQRQAGTSKALDVKDIQSPSSKSVRDASSGRIWTKSNPDRQAEQKQQVSERPSLDPTESVISAVTQFFGIGGDEKPTQTKKIASVRKDQIVATSQQVVDSSGSSNEVTKQASSSKVLESKPSTLTTKIKASPGTSIKNDDITSSTNISKTTIQKPILYGTSIDLKDVQKPESQIISGRPSKDPTESVVSAVTQYFGIGKNDKPSETQKITTDQDKPITATAQGAIEKEDQSKVPVSNVPSTVIAKHKPSVESTIKENVASVDPIIIKNQSQVGNETYNDSKVSRRLTETGETSSKRVTIAPGSKATPSESVVTAVTDFFGISHSVQIAPVSKTSDASMTKPGSQNQTVNEPINVDSRDMQDDKKVISESSTDPRPDVIVAPTLPTATLFEHKDKKIPLTSTHQQPSNMKEVESSARDPKVLASSASSKQPQITVGSKEETPVMYNDQNLDADVSATLTPSASSKVPITLTADVEEIHRGQSPNPDPTSPGPTPRVMDPSQPAPAMTEDSKVVSTPVFATPGVPTVSAPRPTDQSIHISPVSPVTTKEPQTVRPSYVETPRTFDEQNDPATTKAPDAEVSPSSIPVRSGVQASPTAVLGTLTYQSTNNDGPISADTTVEPLAVRSSIVEIPQTIHEQKQPATAKAPDSKVSHAPVSPSEGVLPTPTAVERSSSRVDTPRIIDKQKHPATTEAQDFKVHPSSVPSSSQKSTVDPIPATSTKHPQVATPTNIESSRTMGEPKHSANAKATGPNVISSSGVQTPPATVVGTEVHKSDVPTTVKGTQSASADKFGSPKAIYDSRQPDTPMTQDSQTAHIPVSLVTSTPVVISKQESKKSGINDKVVLAGEVGTGQSNEIATKVPATPEPAQIPEESRIMASNKGIDPRVVVIQKQPTTGREVEDNVSPSSAIKTAVTPDATPIDRSGGASRKGDSSEVSGHSQPIVGAAMENPPLVVENLTETPRTLNEQNRAVPTKIDTNVHPRHVTVVSGSSTGPAQQLSATTSGKLQTDATNKSEISRTLNEPEKGGPAKTDSTAAQSSTISATNVPPLSMNAHDAIKNKGKRLTDPEDQTAVESQTMADTKSSPISAAVPQQPPLATTNAAETARTGEGPRPVQPTTIPRSTVSSGPVVGPPPSHVIVNAPDHRQNDMINTSKKDEPSPPLQPNEPATGSRAAPDAPGLIPIRGSHTSTATARQCWICFASDEDEMGMLWIQPCKCKGTTKWVHQSCLQMWVDEKLREHKDKKVACPQCRTEYLIYLPKANILVRSLDQVDNVIYRICPFVAAGVVIGSFYWNAVTYGAIVMLQVAGSEGASVVAETFQPTVIIVGLPFIPLSLIVFRLFQWEDSFLYILRTTAHCVPLLQYILPGHVVNETGLVPDVPPTGIMSFQRVLAGALLTPVIAKICGNLFFPKVASPGWRTLSGGALFVSVKGLIKMYHKQQNYKRLSRRKILDYTDENKKLIEQTGPVMINQVVPTPMRFQFVASVENRRNGR